MLFGKIFRVITIVLLLFVIKTSMAAQNNSKEGAIILIEDNKCKEAIALLEKTLIKNPDDAEAYLYLGIAYRKLGASQLGNALGGLKEAIKLKATHPDFHFELAQTYDDIDKYNTKLPGLEENPYDLAVATYKRCIQLHEGLNNDNGLIKANLSLGLLYHRKIKYELATESFKNVLKIDVNNQTAYRSLVDCFTKLKKHQDGINELDLLINKSPQNTELYFLRGDLYFLLDKFVEAQSDFVQVLKLEPQNSAAQQRLNSIKDLSDKQSTIATVLKDANKSLQERNYQKAIQKYEEILRINPHYLDAAEKILTAKQEYSDHWYANGCDAVQKKDLNKAIENFNKALEYAQNKKALDQILEKWQITQITLGEEAKLFEIYKEGNKLKIQRKFSQARSYLDVYFQEKGPNKKSKKILDSLKIAECTQIARSKEDEGDLAAALVFYKETFKLDTTNQELKFNIEKLTADIAFNEENWNKAIQYYQRALLIKPNFPDISNKIRQARISQYLPYLVMIIFSIVSILSFQFFKFQKKTKIILSFQKRKKILKNISILFFIILILIIITLQTKNLNFEQGFQIIGTLFFILLIIILVLFQKETSADFKILTYYFKITISKINKNKKIFNKNININFINIINFNEINLPINFILINGNKIPESENSILTIRPLKGQNVIDHSIKFSKSQDGELTFKQFQICDGTNISLHRESQLIQLEALAKENIGNDSEYIFSLNANKSIQIEINDCLLLLNNEEPIPLKKQSYFIEIHPDTKISISDVQSKQFKIIMLINKFEEIKHYQICDSLDNIENLSFLENEETSAVEEGKITINQSEKPLLKRKSFLADPARFRNFSIELDSNVFSLIFDGKLRSLKIGSPKDLRENLSEIYEEIPNFINWFSKNSYFSLIIAIIAWISLLGAIKESNLFESIKKFFEF